MHVSKEHALESATRVGRFGASACLAHTPTELNRKPECDPPVFNTLRTIFPASKQQVPYVHELTHSLPLTRKINPAFSCTSPLFVLSLARVQMLTPVFSCAPALFVKGNYPLSVGTPIIYDDTRLYGVDRVVYGDPRRAEMRLSDEITDCVAFLCVQVNGGFHYGGTGFLVVKRSSGVDGLMYGYLITAKHCIERSKNYGPLYMRINTTDGRCEFIKLDTGWIYSDDRSVDVAILPFVPFQQRHDLKAIPYEMLATDEIIRNESIGIGDELVVTGLFSSRRGEKRNIPIVRFGNISAMPREPLEDNDTGGTYSAYLAEVRSIGGLSGSPVFAYLNVERIVRGRAVSGLRVKVEAGTVSGLRPPSDVLILLGMIRGHWDYKQTKDSLRFAASELQQVNMGIAIITPIQEAAKIIDGEDLVKKRRKRDEEWQKEHAPTLDSAIPAELPFTKQVFESALRKASHRVSSVKSGKGKK